MRVHKWLPRALVLAGISLLAGNTTFAQSSPVHPQLYRCTHLSGILCAEQRDNPGDWVYVGHDEPSVLFYSNTPGSGNSNVYRLRLPKDPPRPPKQDGSGGRGTSSCTRRSGSGWTMCDDQSAPNPGGSGIGPNIRCIPDSDKNVYDSPNPDKKDYIGRHPGGGFMEMQFYPPGWTLLCTRSARRNGRSRAQHRQPLGSLSNTSGQLNAACGGAIEPSTSPIIKTERPPVPPEPAGATLGTLMPDQRQYALT